MHGGGTVRHIARWTALGALFLVPFMPLMVFDSFFFPFITSKAFYFRILVEIAVGAWVILAFLDTEYRPRFSWLGAAVLAFVAWMFIADAFALNAAKAFWSNFERMEGWVFLAHLTGFFFAASAVLRAEKAWRGWFYTSLLVSLILSGYGLLQLGGALAIHQGSTRIDASLGNSAYFAVYLLFSIFVALWLALTEKYAWLKWSLIALAVLETVLLFYTGTRGTMVGLIVAILCIAVFAAASRGGRVRRWSIGALIIIPLLVGAVFLAKDSSFVQGSYVLQRVASITFQDLEVRRTIWHMAFQGALERPLTGWGQEGFNYIFNEYYDPSLHNQEPWFDRAHNAFIDWLVAGGLPAFLLYLSLFVLALALLWKSPHLSFPERVALTGALIGYGVHNIFVFDNLSSYVYFFAVLALIDSQVARPIPRLEGAPVLAREQAAASVLPVVLVLTAALVWYANVPGIRAATTLITAISPSSNVDTNIAAFEELVARPAFAAQEIREQLISFAAAVVQNPQTTNEQKQKAVSLAVREMQKQIETYPRDARERLQLAYLYRVIGDSAAALEEIRAAKALSPRKASIWVEEGVALWDAGDARAARERFDAAYALGPQFPSLAEYAAAGAIAAGDEAATDQILTRVFGATVVDSNVLAVAYYRAQAWLRLIALWKMRAERPGAPVQSWFSLAAAYYAAGDSANAIKTIRAAVERFPDAASAGAEAIAQIEGRTVGQ